MHRRLALPEGRLNWSRRGLKSGHRADFIARGGHLKKEVPEMLAVLRCTYPNIEFSLGGAVGEHDTVVQAMASTALEVAGF